MSDKPSRGTHSVTDAEADRVEAGEGAQNVPPSPRATPEPRWNAWSQTGGGRGGGGRIGAAYAPKYPANYKGLKQEL